MEILTKAPGLPQPQQPLTFRGRPPGYNASPPWRRLMSGLLLAIALSGTAQAEDPLLWLEEVQGEKPLEWVRGQNKISEGEIGQTQDFEAIEARLLEIYDSNDRIPYVGKRGDWYYNFWRDADHVRGIWRRTTLASYQTDAPDWETVLDIDALADSEEENWVWGGASCLYPDYNRCLVSLSRGGADADVTREFDIETRAFVDGGFELPEAKGGASWIDADHVFVNTDFGEGSMTDSGYPRVVKRWTRGTNLEDAELVYEGVTSDIKVGAYADHTPGYEREFVYRYLTFYTNELFEVVKGELVKVDKPDVANANVDREWIYLELREDYVVDGVTYKKGSLIVAPYKLWTKGKKRIQVLFEPTDNSSLSGWSLTQNHLILNVLTDVRNHIQVLTPGKKGWAQADMPGVPEFGQISAYAVDSLEGDSYWLYITDFTTPSTLNLGTIGEGPSEQLKQQTVLFDAEGVTVEQHFATSKDGTKIPYFQVSPKEGLVEGTPPTLLYGYGGFEISLTPSYSGTLGVGWIERGGVYVLANIRGGGEYGPRWHQAALRENRHRAYEDFSAVGLDLVERGVTDASHLGIQGGSNGGLLMGNMYTLYPEQWGAVVCQVPLLDMKRYTKLLAGASWAGEYGDPDTDDWSFVQTFSPYHNIDKDAAYPPILFTTSTRDDRVHPGHARKMARALLDVDKDVLYYENIEGGHGGAANNKQSAHMQALAYNFLWDTLTGARAERVAEAVEPSVEE